jgi:hypothetical protein
MLVYRSVDNGVTWNKALSFPVQIWLNGIGFANNQFVIVGDLDAILTSPDGIGWTSRTSSVITSWHRDVAFGAGTFVAVARKRDTFDVGEITTSADGITWTKLPVPGFDDLRSVTFGAGQFVAVGRNGEAAVSTDGSAWTAVASDTTNELNGVAFGNNRFVIVGRFGTISTAVLAGQNEAPTANAGVDQAARVGDTVVLNGSGSFDDNTATASLEYAWSFVSFPAGSNATFTEVNTATPSFTIDASGTYEIELVVTDEGGLQSLPDVIVVSSDNVAPTAIAGADQLVIVGSIVTLDGSNSSDPEMDELRYLWSIDKRPLGSIADLVTSDVAVTTFAPDLIGAYEVSLTVSDFIGPGVPDSVLVTAVSAEDFAQVEILEAYDTLVSLPPTDVTTEGNQIALGNFFQQATVAIQEGDSAEAINKLQKAIARTDGCVLRGTPDGDGPERDWVTNCADQAILYGSLTSALEALQQ